jgi:hypothetical protein
VHDLRVRSQEWQHVELQGSSSNAQLFRSNSHNDLDNLLKVFFISGRVYGGPTGCFAALRVAVGTWNGTISGLGRINLETLRHDGSGFCWQSLSWLYQLNPAV